MITLTMAGVDAGCVCCVARCYGGGMGSPGACVALLLLPVSV